MNPETRYETERLGHLFCVLKSIRINGNKFFDAQCLGPVCDKLETQVGSYLPDDWIDQNPDIAEILQWHPPEGLV